MFWNIIFFVGFSIWLLTFVVHILALYRSFTYLYSWRKKHISDGQIPEITNPIGISVVKTMSSATTNVLVNLESVFQLKYPKFELLICVHDNKCKAIASIKAMMRKYPAVDAHLFVGAFEIGVNPKINNIMQCYDKIKYQYVWICDSNIIVNDWSLHELASHLKPNVGFVHQLPYMHTSGSGGVGSYLEKVYFGCHHARWYITFDFLGLSCTNGMSSIFDKKLLDEVGGLAAFSHYIAEDHFMGLSYYQRNYKLALSTEPALQNPHTSTVANFIDRMTRWRRLRLTMLPTAPIEPLIECFLVGVIGAVSIHYFLNISYLAVFSSHILIWFLFDVLLWFRIQKNYAVLLSSFYKCIFVWLLQEALTYCTFAMAVWDRKISWHKGTFNLASGGKATCCDVIVLFEWNNKNRENRETESGTSSDRSDC